MSDSPHVAFGVKPNQERWSASSPFRSGTEVTGVARRSIQCKGAISQALASLQGRISRGWDKSKCPCNCVIGIAVKRSLPHSPKLHTKRQRQQSILHFLD